MLGSTDLDADAVCEQGLWSSIVWAGKETTAMQPDGLDVWGLGDLPVPPLIPPPLSSFFRRKGPPPRDRSQDIDMTMMLSANNYVWRRVLAQGRPENVDLLQDWERGERDGKRSKRKQSHLSRCAPTAQEAEGGPHHRSGPLRGRSVESFPYARKYQLSAVEPGHCKHG